MINIKSAENLFEAEKLFLPCTVYPWEVPRICLISIVSEKILLNLFLNGNNMKNGLPQKDLKTTLLEQK